MKGKSSSTFAVAKGEELHDRTRSYRLASSLCIVIRFNVRINISATEYWMKLAQGIVIDKEKTNKKALATVRNKKKELKDLDNHAWESNNETGNNVLDALEQVHELEDVLDRTKESMYKLSYVIRVSASDLEDLKQR